MTSGDQRLLAITPVRDEAAHLQAMAESVLAQTRHPDLWVIADDGSRDGSPELARDITREVEWAQVLAADPDHSGDARDRLAIGAVPRTMNRALAAVADSGPFTHVLKLDGDIRLPRDFVNRMLSAFAERPRLGIYGGVVAEPVAGGWLRIPRTSSYAPANARMWSMECLTAIGGLREMLGWDTVDDVSARMHGFQTGSDPTLEVLHQRPEGSAQGALRGRARQGTCAYIAHQPPGWVVLRGVKAAAMFRPPVIGGAAFLWGYATAPLRGVPRVEDEAFRRFVRSEVRRRMARR